MYLVTFVRCTIEDTFGICVLNNQTRLSWLWITRQAVILDDFYNKSRKTRLLLLLNFLRSDSSCGRVLINYSYSTTMCQVDFRWAPVQHHPDTDHITDMNNTTSQKQCSLRPFVKSDWTSGSLSFQARVTHAWALCHYWGWALTPGCGYTDTLW